MMRRDWQQATMGKTGFAQGARPPDSEPLAICALYPAGSYVPESPLCLEYEPHVPIRERYWHPMNAVHLVHKLPGAEPAHDGGRWNHLTEATRSVGLILGIASDIVCFWSQIIPSSTG